MDLALPPAELDESLLRELLALALADGGDYADVFVESARDLVLRWEDGRVVETSLELRRGVGLRVQSGERSGFAWADGVAPAPLREAARTAGRIAAGAPAPPPGRFDSAALPDRYPLAAHAVPLDEQVDALRRLQDAAAGPDVLRVAASLFEGRRDILVATSEGALQRDIQPLFRLNCDVVVSGGGRREQARLGIGGRKEPAAYTGEAVAALAAESLRLARLQLVAEAAPAGPMALVLGPAATGIILHEAVGHCLEGDFVHVGSSPFAGKLGERVAPEAVSVVDEPGPPGDRGALNVDDEGCPAVAAPLVEAGVLSGFLHDRHSARRAGAEATGNGRRESYRHPPLPRMRTISLRPGEATAEDCLRDTARGLYVKGVGGGTVDIARGDFVFQVTEGYRIEGGRVGAPVRGATLIGKGPEVLAGLRIVAGDYAVSPGMWTCGKFGQHVPVNVGQPHAKVDAITVGGTRAGGA